MPGFGPDNAGSNPAGTFLPMIRGGIRSDESTELMGVNIHEV